MKRQSAKTFFHINTVSRNHHAVTSNLGITTISNINITTKNVVVGAEAEQY